MGNILNKIRYGSAPAVLANGVRLFGPDYGVLLAGRYFAGVDLLGRLWYSASAVGSVAYGLDPRYPDNPAVNVSFGLGSQIRNGTIDGRGYAWFGDTADYKVYRITEAPAKTTGVLLTSGGTDFQPRGVLYDPDTERLYWVGLSLGGQIRLFEVDMDGNLVTISALYSPPSFVLEAHDIAKTAEGDYVCALPNSMTKVLKFAGGSLAPTEITISAARNAGGMGMHFAFGHLWLGADTTQGVGMSPLQLTKMTAAGVVKATKTFSGALRVSDIKDDGEYIFAAVSGTISPTSVGTNRIEKIDPETLTTVASFLYGAPDGLGTPVRSIHIIRDEDPYPIPEFTDAVLWLRGDDPGFIQEQDLIYSARNRGPQAAGLRPLLKPTGANEPLREPIGLIEGRRAVGFGDNPGTDYLTLDPVTSWKFLHDGSAFTIGVAFKPTDASAMLNPLFASLDAAVLVGSLGARLTYDEAANTIRFVSCNGLGAAFTVDLSLALQNVDAPEPMVVVLRVDPAGASAQLRVYSSQSKLAEFESVSVTPVVPGATADTTTCFLGKSSTETTDALVGEIAVLKGYLADYAFDQLAHYLARRWLPA